MSQPPNDLDVQTYRLTDDGTFPNNEALPTVVMRGAVEVAGEDPAGAFEALVRANGWGNTWENGIYPFHHYHSTAHEVLGVVRGTAQVQLGGPDGPVLNVKAGDVLVLPAGVAHKNRGSGRGFQVVGAYPEGQDWDLLKGDAAERPAADRRIADVELPSADPVYGADGPLANAWDLA